jgi:hypothetical protein
MRSISRSKPRLKAADIVNISFGIDTLDRERATASRSN